MFIEVIENLGKCFGDNKLVKLVKSFSVTVKANQTHVACTKLSIKYVELTLHFPLDAPSRVSAYCWDENVPGIKGPSHRRNNPQPSSNILGRLGIKPKTNQARAAKQHEMGGYLKTL